MAITTTTVAVSSSSATQVVPPLAGGTLSGYLYDPTPVVVQNVDAAISVYLGGSNVANSGAHLGIVLLAGQNIPLSLLSSDTLYAIAASGTPNVVVMLGRQ